MVFLPARRLLMRVVLWTWLGGRIDVGNQGSGRRSQVEGASREPSSPVRTQFARSSRTMRWHNQSVAVTLPPLPSLVIPDPRS
ncbi:hypothetical protein PMIN01_00534 [Paraphaeosphaeria minitans]|uniref:Secreted protein n=1 Tax=Paraphaeosphaeria minitans TaxID=565426 RepID=A0A9P6KW31_9PLEO|nr:hypothetical protein PMIN01_00534 [Paraphaeosphaeria minitans]